MSHTEQMREAFEAEMRCEETWGHRPLKKSKCGRYENWCVDLMWNVWQAALTAPAAEVPEAMSEADILSANYPDEEENGPTVAAPVFDLICFAKQIIAARDAQWQSTRLRGGVPSVPEGFVLVPVEPTDEMLAAGKKQAHSNNSVGAKCLRIYAAMLAARPLPTPPKEQA